MRLPFQRRPTARQTRNRGLGLLSLAALAPTLTTAITFNSVGTASIDLSNLGSVGVVGDFSGISLYEYEGQSERTRSTNGSESLLSQLPNGALGSLVSSDASIKTMCAFELSNGEMQGVVIGGNFTSLNGTESKAIALFNPNTTEITPLDGIEGEVNAVYCDKDRDTVYVGGNFKGANSTNALAWVNRDGWTNLPFAGFNGPVNAIAKASNGHIIFGGTFTGLGNTSTPSQPDGQSINLSKANISAGTSTSVSAYSSPENILCSTGSSTWLLQDETSGYWDAEFGFGFTPTKLRLWNAQQDGRGTKTFRFTAYPINGIMNLTYTDPDTGKNKTCSSECPLQNTTDYQDFHFVNDVGMNRFRISISDWYGSGAGLSGIKFYQDDIFSYAINDFNEPSCGVENPSSATATGPWAVTASQESNSKYLSASLSSGYNSTSAQVVFYPDIKESGNYSVNMYTPGCWQDGSCSTRGKVNVTGVMTTGNDNDSNFTTVLYQTNTYDKYDQVFFGYIEAGSDSFRPSITLTPLEGQDVSSLTIVAQRVGFTLIDSTDGLNGLFDFNPKDTTVNTTSIQNSTINKLGKSFDRTSGVTALITDGDTTYVGGNFTSKDHDNILAIIKEEDVQTLDGGLNGQVLSMYLNDTKLFVGGDFSSTQNGSVDGMDNIAVYDTKNDSWAAIGGGVDGVVEYVVPLRINITKDVPEIVIAFSGSFTKCNAFDDNDAITVDGLAVWVPSQNNWLEGLDGVLPGYSGVLTAAILDLPNDGGSLFAGSISSAQLGANGAATLSEDGFGQFPLKIQTSSASSSSNSSSLSRRDVLETTDIQGVVTGLFYDENKYNITVLAGHFTTESSDKQEVNNIVLVEDDKVMGLGSNISSDSTFLAVAVRSSTLFAGGKISGTVDSGSISGLISYNIESKSFNSQPPSLTGDNSTVNAIAVRPKGADVYVGGSFSKAGALDCPGLCAYNVDADQWNRPGSAVEGEVYSMMWASNNELVVGGNLTFNGKQQYLMSWDAKKETWSTYPDSSNLTGPVRIISPASNSRDEIWISGTSTKDGSIFIMKYDSKKWQTASSTLASDSVVRGLQVFTLTESHSKSDILDKDQVLMITGAIDLPGFGFASAVTFNGTAYQPYALTINSDNSPGSISAIFSQKDDFFSSSGHMPLGFVVLIGLAISLGLMLMLVAGGIILDRVRKRREGYTPAPTSMYDRGSGIQRVPPHELFGSLRQRQAGAPHV